MVTKNSRLAAKAVAIAEAQAAVDKALAEALAKRDAEAPSKPAKAKPASLGDNFLSVAAMIAQAYKDTHIAHPNLIKIWELTLMWELNNRNQPQAPIFDPADLPNVSGGEESENSEPDGPPTTADEVIGEFTKAPQETETNE